MMLSARVGADYRLLLLYRKLLGNSRVQKCVLQQCVGIAEYTVSDEIVYGIRQIKTDL